MIHGMAEDFAGDRSPKLVLSHRRGELSPAEKRIGSSATFGMADVLIPARTNATRRVALRCLKEHFPGAPEADVDRVRFGREASMSSG